MSAAVTVDLVRDMVFRASTGSGQALAMDAAPEVGGTRSGARPMEGLLAALGGCTGMDVISVLRKMRQDVTDYSVRVHGESAAEHPKVFTRIHVEHIVRGHELSVASVRRAVELSATRYCPAMAMLRKAAPIDVSYRVIDDATGREQSGELNLPVDLP